MPEALDKPVRLAEFPAPGQPIGQHWPNCFGCGDGQPAGMGMAFVAGEGTQVSGTLTVAGRFEGGPGVIHGGVLTAAFDEVQGMACRSVAWAVVTAHLQVDFKQPVPLGSTVRFDAEVDGVVGRKIYTHAEARVVAGPGADPDAVVGTARALFLTIDLRHFESVAERARQSSL